MVKFNLTVLRLAGSFDVWVVFLEFFKGVLVMADTIDHEQVVENFEECAEDCVTSARLDDASELIASAARWSAAASLVPVPYLDLAGLAAVQSKLIYDLSGLYGQETSKQAVNGVVSVLLGTLLPIGASQATVSVLSKFIPGYGSLVGAAAMAAFGSTATYAIGRVFVRHFEKGGCLSTFSVDSIKHELKKEFAAASRA